MDQTRNLRPKNSIDQQCSKASQENLSKKRQTAYKKLLNKLSLRSKNKKPVSHEGENLKEQQKENFYSNLSQKTIGVNETEEKYVQLANVEGCKTTFNSELNLQPAVLITDYIEKLNSKKENKHHSMLDLSFKNPVQFFKKLTKNSKKPLHNNVKEENKKLNFDIIKAYEKNNGLNIGITPSENFTTSYLDKNKQNQLLKSDVTNINISSFTNTYGGTKKDYPRKINEKNSHLNMQPNEEKCVFSVSNINENSDNHAQVNKDITENDEKLHIKERVMSISNNNTTFAIRNCQSTHISNIPEQNNHYHMFQNCNNGTNDEKNTYKNMNEYCINSEFITNFKDKKDSEKYTKSENEIENNQIICRENEIIDLEKYYPNYEFKNSDEYEGVVSKRIAQSQLMLNNFSSSSTFYPTTISTASSKHTALINSTITRNSDTITNSYLPSKTDVSETPVSIKNFTACNNSTQQNTDNLTAEKLISFNRKDRNIDEISNSNTFAQNTDFIDTQNDDDKVQNFCSNDHKNLNNNHSNKMRNNSQIKSVTMNAINNALEEDALNNIIKDYCSNVNNEHDWFSEKFNLKILNGNIANLEEIDSNAYLAKHLIMAKEPNNKLKNTACVSNENDKIRYKIPLNKIENALSINEVNYESPKSFEEIISNSFHKLNLTNYIIKTKDNNKNGNNNDEEKNVEKSGKVFINFDFDEKNAVSEKEKNATKYIKADQKSNNDFNRTPQSFYVSLEDKINKPIYDFEYINKDESQNEMSNKFIQQPNYDEKTFRNKMDQNLFEKSENNVDIILASSDGNEFLGKKIFENFENETEDKILKKKLNKKRNLRMHKNSKNYTFQEKDFYKFDNFENDDKLEGSIKFENKGIEENRKTSKEDEINANILKNKNFLPLNNNLQNNDYVENPEYKTVLKNLGISNSHIEREKICKLSDFSAELKALKPSESLFDSAFSLVKDRENLEKEKTHEIKEKDFYAKKKDNSMKKNEIKNSSVAYYCSLEEVNDDYEHFINPKNLNIQQNSKYIHQKCFFSNKIDQSINKKSKQQIETNVNENKLENIKNILGLNKNNKKINDSKSLMTKQTNSLLDFCYNSNRYKPHENINYSKKIDEKHLDSYSKSYENINKNTKESYWSNCQINNDLVTEDFTKNKINFIGSKNDKTESVLFFHLPVDFPQNAESEVNNDKSFDESQKQNIFKNSNLKKPLNIEENVSEKRNQQIPEIAGYFKNKNEEIKENHIRITDEIISFSSLKNEKNKTDNYSLEKNNEASVLHSSSCLRHGSQEMQNILPTASSFTQKKENFKINHSKKDFYFRASSTLPSKNVKPPRPFDKLKDLQSPPEKKSLQAIRQRLRPKKPHTNCFSLDNLDNISEDESSSTGYGSSASGVGGRKTNKDETILEKNENLDKNNIKKSELDNYKKNKLTGRKKPCRKCGKKCNNCCGDAYNSMLEITAHDEENHTSNNKIEAEHSYFFDNNVNNNNQVYSKKNKYRIRSLYGNNINTSIDNVSFDKDNFHTENSKNTRSMQRSFQQNFLSRSLSNDECFENNYKNYDENFHENHIPNYNKVTSKTQRKHFIYGKSNYKPGINNRVREFSKNQLNLSTESLSKAQSATKQTPPHKPVTPSLSSTVQLRQKNSKTERRSLSYIEASPCIPREGSVNIPRIAMAHLNNDGTPKSILKKKNS